jgi:hypothetical protein
MSIKFYGSYKADNGDKYIGDFMYNQPEGFGVYTWANGDEYRGFFRCGKSCGIGTMENNRYIMKGNWYDEAKHGEFRKTDKIASKTYLEYWKNNKLIKTDEIQYIAPKYLETKKHKSMVSCLKKHNNPAEKKCIGCCENYANVAVDPCGHVVMCKDCMMKCECCPICRVVKKNTIQLYIN